MNQRWKKMKYDCNKTIDFYHEWDRLCYAQDECNKCLLHNDKFRCVCMAQNYDLLPDAIKIIQEWSDKNPENT